MQVDFYQLSRDPVEQVLPVIAGRILAMGARLMVVASEPERLDRISAGLWAGPPESFLAHGRAGEGAEPRAALAEARESRPSGDHVTRL